MHARTCTHTHARTHTHTHARTLARTHARTHTHTGVSTFPSLVMVCHGDDEVRVYDGPLKLEPLEAFFKTYSKKK